MLIDWFTVIAQIINFLILVWLLKRFLYQPILNAIDARERRITAELANADVKKAEAQQERDLFHQKNETFEQQRVSLLRQVMDEAKSERLRLLDVARQESDCLRTKRWDALRNEQQSLSEAVAGRAREEVFSIARKVLADLAETTLEERMVKVLLRRLSELDDTGTASLRSAFNASSSPLLVRSAFTIPPIAPLLKLRSKKYSVARRRLSLKLCRIWYAVLRSAGTVKRWRGVSPIILSRCRGVLTNCLKHNSYRNPPFS